ncbi:hypothetical protein MASR1M68_00150 [Elusimicrobiota bacterium]
MKFINIAKEIAKEINSKYPTIDIYYDYYDDDNEIFILIDDISLFETLEYKKMIMKMKRSSTIYSNIFFSCISSRDELTENVINLTQENKKESFKNTSFSLDNYQDITKELKVNNNVVDKQIFPNGFFKPFLGFGNIECKQGEDVWKRKMIAA